jgi:carboxypeptidase family protein
MKRYSFVLLVLAACPSKPIVEHPAPPATVAGMVHFVGTPCAQPGPGCDGPMAGYKVEVRAKDGATVVATATTGADGRYSLTVAPGDYTIITKGGIPPTDQRHDFTAPAGETATVDLQIDTGVR